ncbi:MAG: DMT family transporter [Fusobacteriota bacterium]
MKIRGYFFILLSVLLFSSMTLIVKTITEGGSIPAVQVVFFRFVIGLISILVIKKVKNKKVRPVNKKALWARGILNTLAVILFFVTIQLATVTKANIYNLTYPVFVALIAPFVLPEKLTIKKFLVVLLGLAGTFLVVGVKFQSVNIGDLTGILAGFVAGFAIVSLRKVRLTDDSFTILTYLMTIGTVVTFVSFVAFFEIPSTYELILLISVGIVSFLGQYTLTYGMKYLTAVETSLLSSSRIFIASILSVIILGEVLTMNIILGGLLIFVSIILMTLINNKNKKNVVRSK